jgi:hypothetical protein
MSNRTYENIDLSKVCLETPVTDDEVLVMTLDQALTAGTVLGRVTASGKLLPYDSGAADGSQVPMAVLQYDVTATAAGDYPIRPVLGGKVRLDKLHAAAAPLVALTKAEQDALRTFAIFAIPVDQLGQFNNPG